MNKRLGQLLPSGETVLTGGDEKFADQGRRAEVEGVARFIVDNLCTGYADGELTFEEFCRLCRDALAVDHLPAFVRQKILGSRVEFALSASPLARKKGQRARPLWLAKACSELVDDVHLHEGRPIARESKAGPTAYERAAEILSARGIKGMTPVSVEKARAQWSKHTAKR